jgi:hypothetical protein
LHLRLWFSFEEPAKTTLFPVESPFSIPITWP